MVVGVKTVLDGEVNMAKSRTHTTDGHAILPVGAALQYRVVALKRRGVLWTRKNTVDLKALYVVGLQDVVYGETETHQSKKEVMHEGEDESDKNEYDMRWSDCAFFNNVTRVRLAATVA